MSLDARDDRVHLATTTAPAPPAGMLIAARVAQGVGAAISAPTALSLIGTIFSEGRARNRAMGVVCV